jgi:hypothetical protein
MQIKDFLDRLDKRSHLDNELRDNIEKGTELIEVLLADAPKYNATKNAIGWSSQRLQFDA